MVANPLRLLQAVLVTPLVQQFNILSSAPVINSACSSPSLSCPTDTKIPIDTCCVNYPSGHFLMTQFWDTSPPLGPDHSWTIHGLWPDYCTGGFPQFCDRSRNKSPAELTAILSSAAKSTHPDLLNYMIRLWLSNDHRNSNLWAHEWNKHGTCVSTLNPKCYSDDPSYSSSSSESSTTDEAILDYFTHTTTLFSTLNTYTILADLNIVPSTTTTYSLTDLENAIKSSHHGQAVTFRCNRRHELDEVWYHFLIRGSLRNATTVSKESMNDVFIPTEPDGAISNCPRYGIKYLPKTIEKKGLGQ